VVGGGCQADRRDRLRADSSEVTVVAGPIEGAALGRADALGRGRGTASTRLQVLRELIPSTDALATLASRGTS
jgi:hypothetical protein